MVKVFVNNAEELTKVLERLDSFGIRWYNGEKPLEFRAVFGDLPTVIDVDEGKILYNGCEDGSISVDKFLCDNKIKKLLRGDG